MSPLAFYRDLIANGVPEATAYEIAAKFEAERDAEVRATYEAMMERLASPPSEPSLMTPAERKRARDRERMAEKRRQSRDTGDSRATPATVAQVAATSRDTGDAALTCARVVIPSSSLRSEDKPRLPSGVSPAKPKPARSRLVPESWSPGPKLLADLAELGFMPGEIERELANFRDHEFRDPKSDFDRTFRRWMRQSRNFQPRKANDRTDHPASSRSARRGVWAEVLAEERGEGPGGLSGSG